MAETELLISAEHLQRLLTAANGDAALLYLYLSANRPAEQAAQVLRMHQTRIDLALVTLQQLGLWAAPSKQHPDMANAPVYTVEDVLREKDSPEFNALIGEVNRRMGRFLNNEELKILLSIYRYLGLPPEVISILICYCIQRNTARGLSRLPSLRTIEKEAYHWADEGIDSFEQAAAFLQHETVLQNHRSEMRQLLGIHDRRLTAAEERMADQWLEWGFTRQEVQLAYEKTCMNTGGLKWPYLHSILKSWHTQGLHSVAQIKTDDQAAPTRKATPADKANFGVQRHNDALSELQLAAIERMLEHEEG